MVETNYSGHLPIWAALGRIEWIQCWQSKGGFQFLARNCYCVHPSQLTCKPDFKSKIKSAMKSTGGELFASQQHRQSSTNPLWTQNLQRVKDISTSQTFCWISHPSRGGTDLYWLEQKANQPRGANHPFPCSDILHEMDKRQLAG